MRILHLPIAVLALGVLAGLGPRAAADDVDPHDQKFIDNNVSSALGEYKIDQLAKDQSMNDDIKKLAERLNEEHVKLNKEFLALLNHKKIPSPSEMNEQDQAAVDRLAQLKGSAFDQAFLQEQLEGHKRAIARFEDQEKNGKDEDLKRFAKNGLPKLRGWLKQITAAAGGERPAK